MTWLLAVLVALNLAILVGLIGLNHNLSSFQDVIEGEIERQKELEEEIFNPEPKAHPPIRVEPAFYQETKI